ncbi:sulfur carrier protein ThiS [Salmonella enterica]|uniref:sulfur carrier protein ThiS n=1 Tax=Salmonella enterica TaxID=28901 RepID=UPI00398C7AA9
MQLHFHDAPLPSAAGPTAIQLLTPLILLKPGAALALNQQTLPRAPAQQHIRPDASPLPSEQSLPGPCTGKAPSDNV